MIRIAVCEDNAYQAGMLENMLIKAGFTLDIEITVDVFGSYDDFMKHKTGSLVYQVCFLDIDLGDKNGMELAREIRKDDFETIIIFTTSHSEYMPDAFNVHAYQYLIKPLEQDKITNVLKEIDNLINDSGYRFTFSYNREEYSLNTRGIVAIYSDKRLINIISGQEQYVFYGKIDEVYEQLPKLNFVKIRSSCIVNMNYITKIEKSRVWCNVGDETFSYDMSRKYYDCFMNEYREYIKRIC